MSDDLTAVYYTALELPINFQIQTMAHLEQALGEIPLIAILLVEPDKRSHLGIYRQALEGAKLAQTKYIALCEDDVLYSPEHFKYRPKDKPFAYNMNAWNITTWGDPVFTQKSGGRKNLGQLICEREAFIEAMEERFAQYPDGNVNIANWAEPSKYEKNLGVTIREAESFYTNPPNIIFSHETALSYQNLGTRKKPGEIRALSIPYWGTAKEIQDYYV